MLHHMTTTLPVSDCRPSGTSIRVRKHQVATSRGGGELHRAHTETAWTLTHTNSNLTNSSLGLCGGVERLSKLCLCMLLPVLPQLNACVARNCPPQTCSYMYMHAQSRLADHMYMRRTGNTNRIRIIQIAGQTSHH